MSDLNLKLDDELDYDITNHMKICWYESDAYEICKDDNEGYVFGIITWYGQYEDVDIVLNYYNDTGTDVSFDWFKTEQERDKAFNDETGRKFKRFSTNPLFEGYWTIIPTEEVKS